MTAGEERSRPRQAVWDRDESWISVRDRAPRGDLRWLSLAELAQLDCEVAELSPVGDVNFSYPFAMPSPAEPPYYVLVSHRQSPNEPPIPVPSALSHPTIEYHYADDSHHSLLPQFPGEHVIVLDYDPVSNTSATAKSLSTELAVTALRLTDPPGAGIAQEQPGRNGKMHIIETTSSNQER